MASRDLKATETGVVSRKIAVDGIAVVVKSGSWLTNVTIEQLYNLYKSGTAIINTLFFEEEVTKNPAKQITEKGNATELKMAKAIIEGMNGKFVPSDYKDEYRQRVQEAIERKIAGKEIIAPKEKGIGTVANLMDALTKSLELTQKPKVKKVVPKKTTTKKKGA